MTDVSTYPAVRAALVARFEATLNGETDPPVTYGDPGRQVPPRYVAVASTTGPVTHAIKRLPHDATTSVDEDYGLEVVFWSLVKNQNTPQAGQQAAEDVWEIARRLDESLRASIDAYTLGGLVTWAYFSEFVPDDFTLSEGRASQIVATVTVKAARI